MKQAIAMTHGEIAALVVATPEQRVFDWKRDFSVPTSEEAKGEVVKDIVAVANGTALDRRAGMIVYGVHPGRPDPIVGISQSWDDARLQQLARSAIQPPVEFLYHEISENGRTVAVIEVSRSVQPFHVVSRDLGGLREGQILIREGSTTRGIRQEDLVRLYLTPGFGYAEELLRRHGAEAQTLQALANAGHEMRAQEVHRIRQIEALTGLPHGSMGL